MKTKGRRQRVEAWARARARKSETAMRMSGASPEERRSLIPCNFNPTEFEVQAFLYNALLSRGYQVRGEVTTRCGTCIFDLVVYDQGVPVRIIEIKKSLKVSSPHKSDRKREEKLRGCQVSRYSGFGVKVDLVCSLRGAKDYLDRVLMEGFQS